MRGTGDIASVLKVLVGYQLTVAHHAGNMRGFHFGKITRMERKVVGEYALHIQCPWRIESQGAIVTGFQDWYIFVGTQDVEGLPEPESWDPASGGSLQERQLRALLACPPDEGHPIINRTNTLFVTGVEEELHGGCRIALDRGTFIGFVPSSSRGEHWRFFRVGDQSPHLVVAGS